MLTPPTSASRSGAGAVSFWRQEQTRKSPARSRPTARTEPAQGRLGRIEPGAAHKASDGLDDLVASLVALLDHEDQALRGDTADLLGRIGHPAAKAPLMNLLDDQNQEIVEAAQDALDELMDKARM